MPLLHGQPFSLVKPPDVCPEGATIYTIQHTGEKFLDKSLYENRSSLYKKSIWTCQYSGKPGLSHYEAWVSELKTRVAAQASIPIALQRSILSLVHHSLSPLEQLVDAAFMLCKSQFHVGENILLLYPRKTEVEVVKSKDIPKHEQTLHTLNGTLDNDEDIEILDHSNGVESEEKPTTTFARNDFMLPKLYDVAFISDKRLIENVPAKNLLRQYAIPSKDELRIFIRSCAAKQRNSTFSPWVVIDDLVKKFKISNKLTSLFLQKPPSPFTKIQSSPFIKRKSDSLNDATKKIKVDAPDITITPVEAKSKSSEMPASTAPSASVKPSIKSLYPSHSYPALNKPKFPFASFSKFPKPVGRPRVKKPVSQNTSGLPTLPRKRGRPKLSEEEKQRNKLLREATLKSLTNEMISSQFDVKNLMKEKEKSQCNQPISSQSEHSDLDSSIQSPSSENFSSFLNSELNYHFTHPLLNCVYKSPVKRATTPDAIMKLPFMRRFLHEHKTIKGVIGQFRRYAHTMDIVLAKLSPQQIELIPEESLKQDLYARQKKVQDKVFFDRLTPEQRKQYSRDKARTVALERWKERKLKNLKVEDKVIQNLNTIPEPVLVETPKSIPNRLFGDVVMVTDFIQCFKELILGDENFTLTTIQVMQAIAAQGEAYKIIADIMCCILSLIVHDDISKNCREIGVNISVIPVNYQTAPELTRLCLRRPEKDEIEKVEGSQGLIGNEENYQLGQEKCELSDELMEKLENSEFWTLTPEEVVLVLKALVNKSLCTASISVFVDEIEKKVLLTLRERRKFIRQLQKEQQAKSAKRRAERMKNKSAKQEQPKRKRGRPKGFSPKLAAAARIFGALSKAASLKAIDEKNEATGETEKLTMKKDKEKQKNLLEDQKRQTIDKKYEQVLNKRDLILRRTPVGYDREHNRYWVFHTSTPGLYVEKGWVDAVTDYKYELEDDTDEENEEKEETFEVNVKLESGDENDMKIDVKGIGTSETKMIDESDSNISSVENGKDGLNVLKIKEEVQSLEKSNSKMTIAPMKMNYRGRPPKEAYVLVDEDTQTFPVIEKNTWYWYPNIESIDTVIGSLTDQGQRESQLIAALNINKDRLKFHYSIKGEDLKLTESDSYKELTSSLREDIAQIERELIEGWLGGVPDFKSWEKKVLGAKNIEKLAPLLLEAQQSVQPKNLKGIMGIIKEEILQPIKEENSEEKENSNNLPPPTEYREIENLGIEKWKCAVLNCKTYSRLHVLVSLFDSCIRWEKSMATRKCKVCRSKTKSDILLMCSKCEVSYHMYCIRPPLKEDPGECWICPSCVPKKSRREENNEEVIEQEEPIEDQEEKDDPTFSIGSGGNPKRKYKKRGSQKTKERECSVCTGRVGLIFCAQCDAAFHSECHDPPLLSRAKKDWVCGDCVKSGKSSKKINYNAIEDGPLSGVVPLDEGKKSAKGKSNRGQNLKKVKTQERANISKLIDGNDCPKKSVVRNLKDELESENDENESGSSGSSSESDSENENIGSESENIGSESEIIGSENGNIGSDNEDIGIYNDNIDSESGISVDSDNDSDIENTTYDSDQI